MDKSNRSTRTAVMKLAASVALAAAAVAGLVGSVSNVAATMTTDGSRGPDLSVTRSTIGDFQSLMPGDRVTLIYVVGADMESVYSFRASLTGAGLFESQLRADVISEDGEILYSGSLARASFDGRRISAGQTERILIHVQLPLDATAAGSTSNLALKSDFIASRA